jgi:hypothetical protein
MAKSKSSVSIPALLGLGAVAFLLAKIVTSAKASPALQFIAQTAEGTVVQDLETGLFHLLV